MPWVFVPDAHKLKESLPDGSRSQLSAATLEEAIRKKFGMSDGDVSVDDNAPISPTDDGGVHVAAWLWLSADEYAAIQPQTAIVATGLRHSFVRYLRRQRGAGVTTLSLATIQARWPRLAQDAIIEMLSHIAKTRTDLMSLSVTVSGVEVRLVPR
jgi:hypothetical protein